MEAKVGLVSRFAFHQSLHLPLLSLASFSPLPPLFLSPSLCLIFVRVPSLFIDRLLPIILSLFLWPILSISLPLPTHSLIVFVALFYLFVFRFHFDSLHIKFNAIFHTHDAIRLNWWGYEISRPLMHFSWIFLQFTKTSWTFALFMLSFSAYKFRNYIANWNFVKTFPKAQSIFNCPTNPSFSGSCYRCVRFKMFFSCYHMHF